MTREFVSAPPNTTLKDCARIMIKKKVGSLILTDKGKLQGILTEKDIIWAIVKKSEKDLGKIYAKDLMNKKVVTIKPGADITEALDRIKKFKVRRLPVVEDGKVIGMLTIKDILKVDPSLFEMIQETVKIREESKKMKAGEKFRRSALCENMKVCDECGAGGILYEANGKCLCENCFNSEE